MANASPPRPPRTCSSTRTTPWTGIPWGEEALARARARGQAAARLDRLLGLPLVPRDGARVLRGRQRRRADERALRLHQGRPRGAPGRRRDLHGRRAGDDRPRRLAAERVPDARRACRSTPAPTSRPSRARGCRAGAGAGRRRPGVGASSATEIDDRSARRSSPRLRGAAALQGARRRRSTRRRWTPPSTTLRRGYDSEHGGFGGAPKFPAASAIEFLLRARRARRWRCTRCARWPSGGMYDQVGGGFARYSVDARWIVPHFEKMLYDNALLARAYLHGWQVSATSRSSGACARRRSTGCCASCARTRAASPRRWTRTPRASRASTTSGRSTRCARRWARTSPTVAIAHFGIDRGGQLRGREHPRARDARPRRAAPRSSARLYGAREQRVRPGLDDKRLTLLERAGDLARSPTPARCSSEPRYLDAAVGVRGVRAARPARRATGVCCGPTTAGRAKLGAYLEDHAFLLEALLTLVRGDVRCSLVRRGACAGRRHDRALRRSRAAAASSRPPPTASRWSRGARRSRTRRSRRAAQLRRSGCCASPR